LPSGRSVVTARRPNGQAESAGTPAVPPWFEDVTDAVGLNFTHDCGPTGTYFCRNRCTRRGAVRRRRRLAGLTSCYARGCPNTGVGNRLYLQTPDGKFRDASAGSGLDFDGYNVGVAIGDVDNDGRQTC